MSVVPSFVYVFDPKVDKLPPCPEIRRENIILKKHRGPLFDSIGNILWHVASGFTFYRWSIYDKTTGEEIMYNHTAYGLLHFQFMKKLGGGYHIGPSFTKPSERSKGLYAYINWTILAALQNEGCKFFMRVAQSNIASIRGIEKAGFRRVGYMRRVGFSYKLCDEQGKLL